MKKELKTVLVGMVAGIAMINVLDNFMFVFKECCDSNKSNR